jgi:S1-C subfamily serine protease
MLSVARSTGVLPMTDPVPAHDDPFPAAVERLAASVVGLAGRRRGVAAGAVWSPGVVVTAASALGHAERVHVVRPDGETVEAEVRGTDPSTDLAVIAVSTEGLAPIGRRTEPARVGDAVLAVGRDASGLVHASFGRVGQVAGEWRTWRGGLVDRLVRLDGGLYPGLAGAPVGDARGLALGVASPAFSRHHGVVLPAGTVDRVSAALLEHGRVARGWLGVVVQPVALTAAMRDAARASSARGLLVTGVDDAGPAAAAGLTVGDVVVSADGTAIEDLDALRALLGTGRIGTRVRLDVLRGGVPTVVGLEVGERPSDGAR